MTQKLIIKGNLPGRNEAEDAARTHWSAGAKLKKQYTELIAWECRIQKIKPYIMSVLITIKFFERDYRRDADNIIAGTKYILDGLVIAGVIKNDTRKLVSLRIEPVEVDGKNPRIEVEIRSIKE